MNYKILSLIGISWGGLIIANGIIRFLSGQPARSVSFAIGQNIAVVIGIVMFIAGFYYLIKKSKGNSIQAEDD